MENHLSNVLAKICGVILDLLFYHPPHLRGEKQVQNWPLFTASPPSTWLKPSWPLSCTTVRDLLTHLPSLLLSYSLSQHCSQSIPGIFLLKEPDVLLQLCSLDWNLLSPIYLQAYSLPFFRSLLRCHLLSEVFKFPIEKFNFSPPMPASLLFFPT